MKISKSSDVLVLFNSGALPGRPTVCVTLGYLAGADGELVSEQEAWRKLSAQFNETPFDEGLKKAHGTFAVVGNAFAQGGRAVTGLEVRARVGSLEKALHVYGDRRWELGALGWRQSAPAPFVSMPVGLPQAFGGDAWPSNPLGRGYCANVDDANGSLLPNVEWPRTPVLSPKDRPLPATFWPLPASAPERARFIGKTDDRWKEKEFPRLPADTNPCYFDGVDEAQCAPGYWRGDERYQVAGMHADKTVVQGALPALRPRLLWRTKSDPGQVREAGLDLDTVWLLPNTEQVLVLYRALIELSQIDAVEMEALRVYTEKLADPALPQSVLAARWSAETQAQLTENSASSDAKAGAKSASVAALASGNDAAASTEEAAFLEQIWAQISASHAAFSQEAKEAFKDIGQPVEVPSFVRPIARPLAPLEEVTVASVTAKLQAALAQGEQELRQTLKAAGIDPDTLPGRTTAASQADMSLRDALAKADLPAEVRARAQEEVATAEKLEADLRVQIAAGLPPVYEAAGSSSTTTPGAGPEGAATAELPAPRRILDAAAFRAALERRESLVCVRVENADLEGIDLGGVDLSGSEFNRCILRGARLARAKLVKTVFVECALDRADATQIDGRGMTVRGSSWRKARLQVADLSAARCERSDFDQGDLSGAKLTQMRARNSSFVAAIVTQANGEKAAFSDCNLSGLKAASVSLADAIIQDCHAEQASFADARLNGSSWWNVAGRAIDFSKADMSGARIGSNSNFPSGNFDGANLTNASARDTSFESATLRGACLDRALFANCNLSGTDAYRVVATQADLAGSNFSGARWVSANLMQASLRRTTLVNLDLCDANLFAVDVRGAVRGGLALQDAMIARSAIGEPA
ncbi:DUF2169 domain-containing protein [Paraburkholderia sp. SIMBA_055]